MTINNKANISKKIEKDLQREYNKPEYWEKILENEGLENIDIIEGFQSEVSYKVNNILNISNLENKHNVNIHIDRESSGVSLFNKSGKLIGYFKKSNFTYGNIESSEHIEKVLFEEFRGKGYFQLLFDLYKDNFGLPNSETSKEISNILFLLKNGYKISGIYDDSGEFIEFDEGQSIKAEYDLRNYDYNSLISTYKLTL